MRVTTSAWARVAIPSCLTPVHRSMMSHSGGTLRAYIKKVDELSSGELNSYFLSLDKSKAFLDIFLKRFNSDSRPVYL